MEKHGEKSHQEIVAELDERVEKMSRGLAEEGYKFELKIPDESTVVLKVGGRELNFTKKEWYDIKDEDGNLGSRKMEDVIADRIRQLG